MRTYKIIFSFDSTHTFDCSLGLENYFMNLYLFSIIILFIMFIINYKLIIYNSRVVYKNILYNYIVLILNVERVHI